MTTSYSNLKTSHDLSCFPLFQHYFLDASVMMCITHVLLRYFHLTTFFWMFVEGRLHYFFTLSTKGLFTTSLYLPSVPRALTDPPVIPSHSGC